jgi:hypothetical protein
MAAPRMKAPIKKKTSVKKPKVGTVKSPEETRKSISRKQVGTKRPARGVTPEGAKARALTGLKKPPGTSLTVTNRGSVTNPVKRAVAKTGEQVAEKARTAITRTAKNAVGFAEKWIPNAMKPKGGGSNFVRAGGVATAVASIVTPSFMSEKTGGQANYGEKEAIDKGLGPLMKGNAMKPTFPKGKGTSTQPKSSGGTSFPKGKGSAALPKSSVGYPFPKGKGTAALPKGKTSSSNTAATSTAAASSGGTSKAASVAKAKTKTGVGRQTRYERESLAMEQRRSSGKPKKSIFSLFRKG